MPASRARAHTHAHTHTLTRGWCCLDVESKDRLIKRATEQAEQAKQDLGKAEERAAAAAEAIEEANDEVRSV